MPLSFFCDQNIIFSGEVNFRKNRPTTEFRVGAPFLK